MDRLELIKKLAAAADIPASEGEIFFEMFLRKIADERNEEDSLSIENIGTFSFHREETGRTEFNFSQAQTPVEMKFYLSEERQTVNYPKFNLSIGKPVFPLNRRSENFNFILHPHEILHSIESRSDKLASMLQAEEPHSSLLSAELDEVNPGTDTELLEGNIFEDITDSTIDDFSQTDIQADEFLNDELKEAAPSEESEEIEIPDEGDFGQLTAEDFADNAFAEKEISEEDLKEELPAENDELGEISSEETETESAQSSFDKLRSVIDSILSSGKGEENDHPSPSEEISEPQEIQPEIEELPVSKPQETDDDFSLTGLPEEINILDGKFEDPVKNPLPDILSGEESNIADNIIDEEFPVSDTIGEEDTDINNFSFPVSEEAENELVDEEKPETELVYEEKPETELVEEEKPETELVEEERTETAEFADISEYLETVPDDSETDDLSNYIMPSQSQESDKTEVFNKAETTFGELAEQYKDPGTEEIIPEETIQHNENTFERILGTADETTEEKKDINNDDNVPDASFQRVKSLTREFYNLSNLEQADTASSWDFGDNEKIEDTIKKITRAFDESEPAVGGGKDGFRVVKSKKATYEWSPENIPLMFPKDKFEEPVEEIPELEGIHIEEETAPAEKPVTETVKVITRERKKNRTFIIIIIILAIILLAVLGYYKLTSWSNPEVAEIRKSPVVIEREDKVPVMIPEKIEQSQADIKTENPFTEEQKPAAVNNEPIKISDYVYQINNKFYAQVSSWQTKSKVESEAGKYNRKGYKTSIVTSELKSGTWYRLLLGEFDSAAEAENFLKSNLE